MHWMARVTTRGTLNTEDAEALTAAGCHLISYNDQNGTIELHYRVTAATAAEAATLAGATLDAMAAVNDLVANGTLDAPSQVTVTSEQHPIGVPLLNVGGVARRMNVSEPRVRQLAGRPDFPRPIPVPGVPGDLYDIADIDRYIESRQHAPAGGGRPREGDEQLLTEALAKIRTQGKVPLMFDEDNTLQRAIQAQGTATVHAKARVLHTYARAHWNELGDVRNDAQVVAALKRAEELVAG